MTMSSLIQQIKADTLLLIFTVSNAVSVIFPLMVFGIARASNNGEEEDRQQENQYDEYGNYIEQPHWWQFWKSNNYNQQDEQRDEERGAPWWWFWGEEREPEEEGRGTLTIVYLWTVVMIVFLTIRSVKFVGEGKLELMRWISIGFANYAFICCVLLGGLGAIEVEGREVEETGWYGQLSVLLLLTCMFGIASSLVFAEKLRKRIKQETAIEKVISKDSEVEFVSMDSQAAINNSASV